MATATASVVEPRVPAGMISVAVFHDAAAREHLPDVALRLGWTLPGRTPRSRRRGDGRRLRQTLGLVPWWRTGEPYYQQFVTERLAKQLCEAFGLDPWEVGL